MGDGEMGQAGGRKTARPPENEGSRQLLSPPERKGGRRAEARRYFEAVMITRDRESR